MVAAHGHVEPGRLGLLNISKQLTRIVDVQVAGLAQRLADRRLTLEVTPAAREWLALTGYDPAYGARPLRRLVQREIGDQLAKALLAGQIRDGDAVEVDVAGGDSPGLLVRRAGSSAPPATGEIATTA